MQLSDLITSVYEDLEPWITEVRITSSGDHIVVLECDDWADSGTRRRFLLRCSGVQDASVSLGDASPVEWVAEHPVLAAHTGDQAALYFSSAPASAAEVFLTIHEELTEWLSALLQDRASRRCMNCAEPQTNSPTIQSSAAHSDA